MDLIYFQFLLGFVLLIKGADWLVKGAIELARRFHVSDLVIGLTIVSFGTSAPELAVNSIASINNQASLALGNIIGSNIANIFLILGVVALFTTLRVNPKTAWREIPMNFLIPILLLILANDQFIEPSTSCTQGQNNENATLLAFSCNMLGRSDAIILLIFFAFFIYYVYQQSLSEKKAPVNKKNRIILEPLWKSIILGTVGFTGLIVGGDWIVNGAVHIAKLVGLSESVIGITIIGIGTSLPELATSVVAAHRGKTGIAIGNALGSNIFNILWVLSLSMFITPIVYDTNMNFDILAMGLVSFFLFSFMFIGKRYELNFKKGLSFLGLYILYITFLLLRSF